MVFRDISDKPIPVPAIEPLCAEQQESLAQLVFGILIKVSAHGRVERVEAEEVEVQCCHALEDDQPAARWPAPYRNSVLEEDGALSGRMTEGFCGRAERAAFTVGLL